METWSPQRLKKLNSENEDPRTALQNRYQEVEKDYKSLRSIQIQSWDKVSGIDKERLNQMMLNSLSLQR